MDDLRVTFSPSLGGIPFLSSQVVTVLGFHLGAGLGDTRESW